MNRLLYFIASGAYRAPQALLRSTERWHTVAMLARFTGLLGLVNLGLLAHTLISGNQRAGDIVIYGLNPSLIALVLFTRYQFRRACERIQRELVDRESMLCYECGYDLSGGTPSGTCPECGVGFERTSLAHRWRVWLVERLGPE